MKTEIEFLHERVALIAPSRSASLFSEFLPKGYRMTTLSLVEDDHKEKVIEAKVKVGTLITLYDDLADHPKYRDAGLLKRLYRYPFEVEALPAATNEILSPTELAVSELWKEVMSVVVLLPNYCLLRPVFEFDVNQVYTANRYGELVSDFGELTNRAENRAYAPHSMGLILAGTIDLMATSKLEKFEIGAIRSFLHSAQVLARLMNVMSTFEREAIEGDVTSEIYARVSEGEKDPERELTGEMKFLFEYLSHKAVTLKSFNAFQYIEGLRGLHRLHESLRGVI